MEITPELIHRLSQLSRLALTPEEEARLEGELRAMVGFFEQLGELETEGLPEMPRPVELHNILRPDEVRPSLEPEEALSVAIEQEEGMFRVPRVIE
ncbi:Asp-tRNA(Asn)/Glu-tRNA(Gln) amidotransferase subunit GatC [Meiothermus granaticius]|uniref:Aspartyl/glutamyl-tRNA(Asn/Gln) amidotransferase subunit C n=1 Tax=Meiothermus granaticius NBRC 107808 TaxID=1227551 RepID=A0A399F726_9DEIN|nr:Asp-tRNA(Asn)/Glu-tRNA(Gln) amidotransferase subunit GatC [Meiothermus granaticius]MCL6526846.1 Asp-tRNA(Asn)/Glu-tRNA(Gln) amidotransferase subunit GatC [Thermaceae bacterium]RIH92464.1 Aspartyl/glutamyl-tRNA(Asn/Gln) amidotransferase subunit C [Meiothermus granaticius NBRC 107808]GEM87162.1 aspartyl/glutamyl-tRNA(Asn/Gln) amidotransferase subunit C [Meiothermus granaticius NBRC 107808]